MTARILSFLMLSVILSCSPDDHTPKLTNSIGEITGPDNSFCECCDKEAYFIMIDGIQYRFLREQVPQWNLNSADVRFPIPVRVHWRRSFKCLDNDIVIKKMTYNGGILF